MGDKIKSLSKEEHMRVCHSHNVLCEGMFVGNATNVVEYVAMQDTSTCEVDINKKGLFVHWTSQAMMPKGTNNKIVNVIKMKEREYLFKNGEYVEYSQVKMLKEVLCMFVTDMGRGGC